MNLSQPLLTLFILSSLLACKQSGGKVIRPQEHVSNIESTKTIANPPLDKSPMDVSYYPAEFTVEKMGGKANGEPIARVIYSRPARSGRNIFGEVVRYGKPWRLGANESTEIEFFRDVMVQGKDIRKGKYTLYCVPFEDKWELKLNASLYVWGLKIDPKDDLFSFTVPTEALSFVMEYLSMQFLPAEKGFALQISWDKTKVLLPIEVQ